MNHKFNKYVLFFLVGDFVLFYAALYLVLFIRSGHWESLSNHFLFFLPLFLLYEVVLYISGILDRKFVPSPKRVFDLLLRGHLVATILMFVYFYLAGKFFGEHMIDPGLILVMFSIVLFAVIYAWKLFRARLFNVKPVKAILIGEDKDIEENFRRANLWDMHIVEQFPDINDTDAIEKLLEERDDIGAVIVDIDRYPRLDMLYKLIFKNINILNLVTIKEELSEKIDLDRINELWFITNIRSQEGLVVTSLKRVFDLLLSVPVLIIYGLSFPILSFLVKRDGGEVFFEMPRVGMAGKVFTIRKFRSMSPDPDDEKKLVGHKKEVTKIGAFMRKTGLDELPQVMSVIRGDMSFIGPRPEIPSLVKKYEKEIEHYQIRHLVKPGLSGWAQVMQENAPHHSADVELTREKLAYDLYYIKNHSPFLYLIIVLKTIKSLMNRTNHG